MATRPVIIYVSGAPGSGKTTLADRISKELYIPHISSDLVHGGAGLTIGAPNDRYKTLHEAYIPLLLACADFGISIVVDHVLQKGISEQDILEKLSPKARIVIIHTYCDNPIERHLERELSRSDKGKVLTDDELRDRAKFHHTNLSNTASPIPTQLPLLEVDTNNGYQPNVDKILAFIQEKTNPEKDLL